MQPRLSELSQRFPLWLCDVWGVIHNGHEVFAPAVEALHKHIANGGVALLLTNSPRSRLGVMRQLRELGVPDGSYSSIVTSGDVTQDLMRHHARGKVFHLGPTRDLSIFEGQGVDRVSLAEAHAVLCTGLIHDDRETPEDYRILLAEMLALRLPMISANPDKVVRKGDRLLYCAGALAEAYAAIGGEVLMAGKPFAPIYQLAVEVAASIAGRSFANTEIIAIGDGPETDIRGARDFGLPAVLVAGGVNDASLTLDEVRQHVGQLVPGAGILLTQRALAWT